MKRHRNPFTLLVAQGDDFCDRKSELQALVDMGENRQNVVFYSPRRYGKTSLITRALSLLEERGFVTVYADLYHISSERDFITEFSRAAFKTLGKGIDPKYYIRHIQNFFSGIQLRAEVTPQGTEFKLGLSAGFELGAALEDLLQGIRDYVRKQKLQVCYALDEFQQIAELREGRKIEAKMRSQIQLTRDITYFFIGSRRHMLKSMFGDRKRPFYKSTRDYQLREIAKDDFVPYIISMFAKSGKKCSASIAGQIYELARGYPYYVQMLAQLVWDFTEAVCTDSALEGAFKALVKETGPEFTGIWDNLSMAQRHLLKAFSRSATASFYSKDFLEQNYISAGGVQKAVKVLLENDLIEKVEGSYRLTDPIMREWLRLSRSDIPA